jgi:hypothetical protein
MTSFGMSEQMSVVALRPAVLDPPWPELLAEPEPDDAEVASDVDPPPAGGAALPPEPPQPATAIAAPAIVRADAVRQICFMMDLRASLAAVARSQSKARYIRVMPGSGPLQMSNASGRRRPAAPAGALARGARPGRAQRHRRQ